MFDLAFTIPIVSSETISVTRSTGSYDSFGVWSQSADSTISGIASIQPLDGEEIQRVPEAMRAEAMVKIWFTQELRGADTGLPGDRFSWMGSLYEVQGKVNWSATGNYYQYVARKVVQ